MTKYIEKVHEESRGTYDWPRVHAEPTLGLGPAVNHKRVARLMREAGLQSLYRRRRHGATVHDPGADPHPDLVERRFAVEGPNRLWVTDITEHPTGEGNGDCYDNSVMESFWATMQLELLDSRRWSSRTELANGIFEWLECWYNPKRRHFSAGCSVQSTLR